MAFNPRTLTKKPAATDPAIPQPTPTATSGDALVSLNNDSYMNLKYLIIPLQNSSKKCR